MHRVEEVVSDFPYELEAITFLHKEQARSAISNYPQTQLQCTIDEVEKEAGMVSNSAGRICDNTTRSVVRVCDTTAAMVVLAAQSNPVLGRAYDRHLDEASKRQTPAVLRQSELDKQDPEEQLAADAINVLRSQRVLANVLRQTGINNTEPLIRRSIEQHVTDSRVARAILAACDTMWLQALMETEPLERAVQSIGAHSSSPEIAALFAAALDARVVATIRDEASQGYPFSKICSKVIGPSASQHGLLAILEASEALTNNDELEKLKLLMSAELYWAQHNELPPEQVWLEAYTTQMQRSRLIHDDDQALRVFGRVDIEESGQCVECIVTKQHRIVRIGAELPQAGQPEDILNTGAACYIVLDSGTTHETFMYPRKPRIAPSYLREASATTRQQLLKYFVFVNEQEA